MYKDYSGTLERLAPGAATPEVTFNDDMTLIEAALTELAAAAGEGGSGGGSLPAGDVGQFLRLVAGATGGDDPVPAWADMPAELPPDGAEGQYLRRTASGVEWADVEGGGGGGPTGYGAHRYWRVYMRGGSGYYAYTIAQLDFLDRSGQVIAATGGGYLDSNSGRSDSNSADKAFDNDPGTFWQGKGENSEMVYGPSYLGYVFPTATSVFGVKLTARNTGGGAEKQVPNDMVLQFSDDGKSWIGALSFGGNSDYAPSESRVYKSIYSA